MSVLSSAPPRFDISAVVDDVLIQSGHVLSCAVFRTKDMRVVSKSKKFAVRFVVFLPLRT